MSASTERAKWTSGAPSRAIPDGVIRFSSILASAGWSGHGWCTTVDQAAIALGEKPVALDEKMLERVPVRPRRRPARLVGRRERRAQPSAPVVDPAVSRRSRHRRDGARADALFARLETLASGLAALSGATTESAA
jgi:hypothetical protein